MEEKIIHILIVDDHQIIIDGIKSLLNNINNFHVVAEARNGKEAISVLANTKIDLILMDIEMPILNGIDATKIIINKYPNMKIIALTTYDEKSIINKMIETGAKGYILKNVNKDILTDAIKKVSKGEVYFGNEISIALAKKTFNLNNENTQDNISILSKREIEILKNIANGLTNKEIGKRLFISKRTVETHRNNIMSKLDIHNTIDLVKFALKNLTIE